MTFFFYRRQILFFCRIWLCFGLVVAELAGVRPFFFLDIPIACVYLGHGTGMDGRMVWLLANWGNLHLIGGCMDG